MLFNLLPFNSVPYNEILDLSKMKAFAEDKIIVFNPFPNMPWFLRVYSTGHMKTLWEKEKLLVTSNFSFSHTIFYPFLELSTIFTKLEIVNCKLFEFGRV